MKKVISICLTVLLIFSLIGCSTSKNDTSSDAKDDNSEIIELQVMDWYDSSKELRDEFHKQYEANNPNVKINYTVLTSDQFKNTILSSINSGDAPDVFPVPLGMDLDAVSKDGWIQSLTPLASPDFQERFIDGSWAEGVNMIDGEMYTVPDVIDLPSTAIFYNKDLFEKAGLDPEQPPRTFAELREYSKLITEAGNGEFYGIIEGGQQLPRWNAAARDFSALGGTGLSSVSPVSLLTDEGAYSDPVMGETFELFQGIAEDGSFHPSTMSISAPEARALFGAGQAGFIIQGVWCVGVWEKENPDLNFGVGPQVIPDSGRTGSVAMNLAASGLGISAASEHAEEAMKYIEALSSNEYDYQKDNVSQGIFFSTLKGINDEYLDHPILKDYYDYSMEMCRLAPHPKIENPNTSAVYVEYNDVSPGLGDLLQGVVAGAITDIDGNLKSLDERINEAFNNAIEAAKDKGVDVSKDDFNFDWDPMTNY
ncbi:hypothetical protein SH2C18_20690 [Clostridium sediminicola]|uniref:ABC transporter substrate-binding protein n=1 Tax=Clostridium sediminicola TaxID=3114879 RepID=UPI0031F25C25